MCQTETYFLSRAQKREEGADSSAVDSTTYIVWLLETRNRSRYTTTGRITLLSFHPQISEPSVVEESFRGQYEGLRLQLHLHASLLHEAWHRPVAAGVLRPGRHLLQPHHALCQPRILALSGKVLEIPQRARQAPLHGALPGQLGLGAVRGSDGLRLLAVLRGPGRAAGQPPLLRQHPAIQVVPRNARGVRPALASAQKRHAAHESGTLPTSGRTQLELTVTVVSWSSAGFAGNRQRHFFRQEEWVRVFPLRSLGTASVSTHTHSCCPQAANP